MKRLFFILLSIPLILQAQHESKYMSGAVPVVDGKVVFTRYLNVADFNQEQIYNAMFDWSARTFTGASDRVLLADPKAGTIVAQTQNEIVVKIGLFPGKVKMSSLIKIICSDGNCTMETSRIRYTENPASGKPTDVITAEEYITDQYAMNKTRTKIHKGIGDYRIATIDIVDKNAAQAQTAVYAYNNNAVAAHSETIKNTPAPTSTPAVEKPAAEPTVTQHPALQSAPIQQPAIQERAKQEPQAGQATQKSNIKVADGITNKLESGELVAFITAVEGKPLKRAIAGKGALDLDARTPAVSFNLDSDVDNIIFILEMANNYTIAICNAEDSTAQNPVTIINCKKTQQFGKLFIGEITGATTN